MRWRRARRSKERSWDERWDDGAPRPGWLEDGPRRQVCDARSSAWIAPGMTVIDLGCGLGHTAAWLASLGHEVYAVDVSSVAIARARELHGSVPGLTFECADVAAPMVTSRRFDLVLDLGCLHQLGSRGQSGFGANVRRLTATGSRFFSLMRFQDPNAETPESKAEHVQRILGEGFALERAEPTGMESSVASQPRPGVELRFERVS